MTGLLGWLLAAGALALCLYGYSGQPSTPSKAPNRPAAAPGDGEWLLVPFQVVGALAWLCWAAIGLAVFLAPLAALAWLVSR